MCASKKPLKVYTSMYDIFGPDPYNNPFYVESKKSDNLSELPMCRRNPDCAKSRSYKSELPRKPPEKFITSEMMNPLINKLNNYRSNVANSSSTSFYDLDSVAKRHSFRCLSEICFSNVNVIKSLKRHVSPKNVFEGKSNAIIQDCATEVHPAFTKHISKEIAERKITKKLYGECLLSCEMCLKDDESKSNPHQNSTLCYDVKDQNGKGQKFWSYGKHRSENNSGSRKKKDKKRKEKKGEKPIKHIGDPCPCHLFSFGCPCNDKSSLTELAKSSKSLTVIDQITSTLTILETFCDKRYPAKRLTLQTEDKLTGLSGDGLVQKHDKEVSLNESTFKVINTQDTIQIAAVPCEKKVSNKIKRLKKSRLIMCPKCKEKVDISLEISTEDEDSSKLQSAVNSHPEIPKPSANAPAHKVTSENQEVGNNTNTCVHEPKCELVHVCQILPNNNNITTNNAQCLKKLSIPKPAPRIIKITKACRHHPPCTVVPSCQRANVLKNNCEYVPPCLHRPRCVNLPLCVPFTKSLHYDESTNNYVDLEETAEGFHVPRCKYMTLCQHDSLENNAVSHMQNTYELMRTNQPQTYFQNQTYMPSTFSPHQLTHPCNCCKLNKSCQHGQQDSKCFDIECKCYDTHDRERSNNAVVFIRDVGCQFRNKTYTLDDAIVQPRIRYTSSSNSLHLPLMKMGNYYPKVHTVRCEDKFTNPKSGEEYSLSIDSITSVEIDVNCPSHGCRAAQKAWPFGFNPDTNTSPYVAAYMTHTDPILPEYVAAKPSKRDAHKSDSFSYSDAGNGFSVKPGKKKRKCRKTFCIKQRRKSKSNQLMNCCSKRAV